MIDQLIHAYRAQIYDFSISRFWEHLKTKWKVLLICIICILAILAGAVYSILFSIPILMYITIIAEFILFAVSDNYLIKKYKEGILTETSHLEKVATILQTILPNGTLYTESQIELLIDRLSERIISQKPFGSLGKHLFDFAKYIIIPIITFIAGAYSGKIPELEFSIVASFALGTIVFLAIIYAIVLFLFPFVKRIVNRDYYACIALCEDLKDIKLLYFSSTSSVNK